LSTAVLIAAFFAQDETDTVRAGKKPGSDTERIRQRSLEKYHKFAKDPASRYR
jgi:hypothetical protein